jgi:hypothetical protein
LDSGVAGRPDITKLAQNGVLVTRNGKVDDVAATDTF